MNNCGCSLSCTLLAVLASIIIGVVAAFLTITGTVAVTPAFLWVLFGIAVGYLAVSFITLGERRSGAGRCVCRTLPVFLAGILGTILTSVVLLGIEFAATSVLGAVFVGLLLFFFSLTVTTTVCLVKCLAGCDSDD